MSLLHYILKIEEGLERENVQFSSVAHLYPTLCDPMDCNTPGLPVYHQLLELAQTHVHQVGNAIHPSHRVLSLFPPAFNLSQHQGAAPDASAGASLGGPSTPALSVLGPPVYFFSHNSLTFDAIPAK